MYTLEQKISHLQALYHLALSDGNVGKAESVYIRIVAEGLGISTEELEQYKGGDLSLVLPDREYKLYSLFHRLAIIIMVDGEVHKEEEKACFDLGIKMGLHPNAIDEIINLVSINNDEPSPQEIITIFKRYSS